MTLSSCCGCDHHLSAIALLTNFQDSSIKESNASIQIDYPFWGGSDASLMTIGQKDQHERQGSATTLRGDTGLPLDVQLSLC